MTLRLLRRRLLWQYLLTVGLLLAAAETALYLLVRWAGQRELDAALIKEIEKLTATVRMHDGKPWLPDSPSWNRGGLDGQSAIWQVLVGNGINVRRSQNLTSDQADLPALGGNALPLEQLGLANAEYGGDKLVRAARLRTVYRRTPKSPRRFNDDYHHWHDHGHNHAPWRGTMPDKMVFDIRAVIDRAPLDGRLTQLLFYLAAGFPMVLSLATVGGVWLIRRAVRPVEQSFARERRFTGAASHELRTPLTALRAEIEITLRRDRTPAEYEAALRRMDQLVARMTGLVEGLLILARARAGHLLTGAAEVPATELRAAIEAIIRLLPGHERIQLTCALPEDMHIAGDSLLLAVAVRNLVENALVHSPEGPVHLFLGTNAAGEVECTVSDSGSGFPEAILAAYRNGHTDTPPKKHNARTGLGLSITHAVIESHGGRLSLQNRPDGGGLAAIALPRIKMA
jgi:signal transduction histidine kinase